MTLLRSLRLELEILENQDINPETSMILAESCQKIAYKKHKIAIFMKMSKFSAKVNYGPFWMEKVEVNMMNKDINKGFFAKRVTRPTCFLGHLSLAEQ
jgi:hypothetical protein